ncbi:hypothetical protein HDU89_003678 [Geranomyces variabilis]|nr:hypothetical protein HDU89_003678 [Geranomyces variabilis]
MFPPFPIQVFFRVTRPTDIQIMAAARSPASRRILSALAVLSPLLVFNKFVYSVGVIEGRSMQPALNPDTSGTRRDIVLLARYAPVISDIGGPIAHGDAVFLTAPHDPSMTLVKRVIALEGDAVRPRRGAGEGIGSWVRDMGPHDGYVRIPLGQCWVESDEPFRGVDSNVFGPVPLGLIDSKVAAVLWPLDRAGKVPRRMPKPGRVVHEGRILLEVDEP